MKALLAALVLSLSLNGCGYTFYSRPGSVNTRHSGTPLRIDLGVVENQVLPPRPGLEFDLTRRLKDEIQRHQGLELSEAGADLRLQVALVEYDEPAIVRDFNDVQTEIGLRARARVRVTQGTSRRDHRVRAHTSYAPGKGETRSEGRNRLFRELALRVIDTLDQADWRAKATE